MSDSAGILQSVIFIFLMGGMFGSIETLTSEKGYRRHPMVWVATLGVGVLGLLSWCCAVGSYTHPESGMNEFEWVLFELIFTLGQLLFIWCARHTDLLYA